MRRIGLRKSQRLREDGVFRVVARESHHKWHACADDCQTAHEHGASCPRHHFCKAAHLAHVVGVAGMDHRSRTQKEQALEKCVGEKVEETRYPSADAKGQHHVPQLADR